ncbi:MAG: pantoate--beta-alanine ligase [Clostridia bacterium]|nr:pantoate--beta-alanine ligase [Bacillota bacterium]MBO2521660.1 pantoate--beta-alanine ligase [Bacillota bacterium]
MEVVTTVQEMRQAVARARAAGARIGFVPTMGALHEGHGALVDASVAECDVTVVSIFVNPLQFGPAEDFHKYPRDLEADKAFCQARGVDFIFAPSEKEMYPEPPRAFVEVEELTAGLCGAFRPGHFRGVTTVVTKLFHIVMPDVAYFGQKDYQQLAVIRRMVDDLNFPVEIRGVPTVREADGLAMSSRNRYLNPEERRAATALYRGLTAAKALLEQGERNADRVRQRVREELAKEPLVREQYVEVVDADDLSQVSYIDGRVAVAVAAFVGTTRLIDNIVFDPSAERTE